MHINLLKLSESSKPYCGVLPILVQLVIYIPNNVCRISLSPAMLQFYIILCLAEYLTDQSIPQLWMIYHYTVQNMVI